MRIAAVIAALRNKQRNKAARVAPASTWRLQRDPGRRSEPARGMP